jgi:hypothetical protein
MIRIRFRAASAIGGEVGGRRPLLLLSARSLLRSLGLRGRLLYGLGRRLRTFFTGHVGLLPGFRAPETPYRGSRPVWRRLFSSAISVVHRAGTRVANGLGWEAAPNGPVGWVHAYVARSTARAAISFATTRTPREGCDQLRALSRGRRDPRLFACRETVERERGAVPNGSRRSPRWCLRRARHSDRRLGPPHAGNAFLRCTTISRSKVFTDRGSSRWTRIRPLAVN